MDDCRASGESRRVLGATTPSTMGRLKPAVAESAGLSPAWKTHSATYPNRQEWSLTSFLKAQESQTEEAEPLLR